MKKFSIQLSIQNSLDCLSNLYINSALLRPSTVLISCTNSIKEIILALSSNVNGQTTLHYVTDQLKGVNSKITKLAQGIPFGGEINFIDSGSLITAIKERKLV